MIKREQLVRIVVGIIILSIVAIAGLTFITKKPTSSTNPSISEKTAVPTPKPAIIKKVSLTAAGFEPKSITINRGETIMWINNSGKEASVNSADHPTHKKYPFLNQGLFKSGANLQAEFKDAGTFQYHNHLNPQQTGTVIVK